MSHINTNFGIVTERSLNRISFFNTDTQTATHQIPVGVDAIDVDITLDAVAAAVTASTARTILQLNLLTEPPVINDTETLASGTLGAVGTATFLTDRFAITVNAVAPQNQILSYSFDSGSIVSALPAAVSVAYPPDPIFPTDPIAPPVVGLDTPASFIRFFDLTSAGTITPSLGPAPIPAGGLGPEYITSTSSRRFSLISNFLGNSISVLVLTGPGEFQPFLADTKPASASPMGIAVSANEQQVFVLTAATVDRFSLNPATGILTPLGSFPHGLIIPHYPGVTQIALDPPETKLFISGSAGRADVLAVFTSLGVPLGIVPGIAANGGIDTAVLRVPARGISWDDIDWLMK